MRARMLLLPCCTFCCCCPGALQLPFACCRVAVQFLSSDGCPVAARLLPDPLPLQSDRLLVVLLRFRIVALTALPGLLLYNPP